MCGSDEVGKDASGKVPCERGEYPQGTWEIGTGEYIGSWVCVELHVASSGIKRYISGAKTACLDMNLMKAKMAFGVSVVIDDPNKLEDIRKRESDITAERIKKILAGGANVILTTKGIDDMCLKYFVEAGAMAVRRVKKDDMKRIAKATGAQFISTLANLEGEETFESDYLGYADEVVQERISDDECILIKGCYGKSAVTLGKIARH